MDAARQIGKILAPIIRRLRLAVSRAVVQVVNDSLAMQGLQLTVLSDEVRDNVERFQDYGFTAHPHPGAEAIVLAIGGSRNHSVVIKVDDRRYRLKELEAGEVALYSDEGDKIVLKRDRIIEVTAGTKVSVIAPLVEMSGNLNVTGTIHADVDVTAASISLKTHKHGGVLAGGAQTGVPV